MPQSNNERTSEYNESFKEWPLTNTASSHHPNASGSPFPLFYGNNSEVNDKSIYSESYIENNSFDQSAPPAGIPYKRVGDPPIFYAWPQKAYEPREEPSQGKSAIYFNL